MSKYVSKKQINNHEEYELMCTFLENEIDTICPYPSQKNFFIKIAIYEAFNNAYQYGAFPISLTFTMLNNRYMVRITDSGTGFPVAEKLQLIQEKGTQQLR